MLFYLYYKSDNLIKPMFTGYKLWPAGEPMQAPRMASNWLAVVVLALAACAVYLVVRK